LTIVRKSTPDVQAAPPVAVPLKAEKLTVVVAVIIPVRVIVTGSTCDSSPANVGAENCTVVPAGVGLTDGVGDGVGVTLGVGLGVGDTEGVGVGVVVGATVGDTDGVGVGVAVGVTVGLGVGQPTPATWTYAIPLIAPVAPSVFAGWTPRLVNPPVPESTLKVVILRLSRFAT